MYRSILVATDDSPPANNAVSRAITLAQLVGASLHALYVIDSRLGRTTTTTEPFRQTGEDALDEVDRIATSEGVPVSTTIEEGRPADVILNYAATHDIDLIILGGKTKSTAERIFIGNTAERVVRQAPISVLVVREAVSPT